MSTFVEALFAHLSNYGTTAAARIYPLRLPEDVTLPAVTYQQVSALLSVTHSGASSLRSPRFQVDCYAATYLEAISLAQEVSEALHCFKGNMSGAEVEISFIEDDGRDDVDADTGRYRRSLDVIIWHQDL